MKTLSCKSMGIDCDFVAEAETDEEVIKKGLEHADDEHTEYMEKMRTTMSEQQIMDAAKMKIKTV
ncbi:MAG: DUF1059 domain-containing protein [Candidatus Magasanikbacteria bacterium]